MYQLDSIQIHCGSFSEFDRPGFPETKRVYPRNACTISGIWPGEREFFFPRGGVLYLVRPSPSPVGHGPLQYPLQLPVPLPDNLKLVRLHVRVPRPQMPQPLA
jgi:hypothetical protein